MTRFSWTSVVLVAVSLSGSAAFAAVTPPVAAPSVAPPAASAPELTADPATASAWQLVIASQIQAFRDHDAVAALNYAGDEFHKSFADPRDFFMSIINSGYSPIMESVSQSFGPYKLVAPDMVLQEVKLTGSDQSVYEAIYQLSHEAAGWRVHGVQLMKTQSLGI